MAGSGAKIARIAVTEYLNAVRSKAFIIGVVLMPVMMGGGAVAHVLAEKSVDLRDRRFAVVDEDGRVAEALEAALEKRNERAFRTPEPAADGAGGSAAPAERKQEQPLFLMERWTPPAGEERSPTVVLSDRVRDDDLFAFVVVGEDVFEERRSKDDAVSYYSDSPTYDDLPDWIERTVQEAVEAVRFERADLDAELVADLTRPVRFKDRGLVTLTETGGEVGGEEEDKLRTFLVPVVSMFLLFMLVMMSAPQALNVVLEEKMQKISELLVSAVTPFQLMAGKLLGTVFVSWTLSLLYLGGIWFATHWFDNPGLVPPVFYGWFLFFQLLALLIFTSLFSAIGAACSEMRDAQSLMTPAMMLVLLPVFFWIVVLKSPDGPMSVAISLFPPATPMLMMMRVAIPPGPPAWQLLLAVVLTIAFTAGCIWAAGKVFRIGLLSTGQTPTLRRIAGWVLSR